MLPEMELLYNTDEIRDKVKQKVGRSLKTIDQMIYEIGISNKTYYSFIQGKSVGRRTLIKINQWL